MKIYKDKNGNVLPLGSPFELAGIAYPANWLLLASASDLSGRQITVTTIDDPVPPTPVTSTLKAEFWRRAFAMGGDDLVNQLDTALQAAPTFLRRMWDDNDPVKSDAPEYATLTQQLDMIVTPAQRAQLLAQS